MSTTSMLTQPKGLLFDYGGTLVEEVDFNPRAGNELLLSRAVYQPEHVSLRQMLERSIKVSPKLQHAGNSFTWKHPGQR